MTISVRRYYLLKRRASLKDKNWHFEGIWRFKQENLHWPDLPAGFPSRAKLIAEGYTTVRDIDGADVDELKELGLTRSEAEAVLEAMESWKMIPTVLLSYQRQDGRYAEVYNAPLFGSVARTATETSDTYEMGELTTLRLLLDVTAASGSSPTLDVVVQTSHNGVDNWRNLLAFAQKTAVSSERQCVSGADRYVRAVATIGGTTPSLTFSLSGEAA